MTLKVGDVVQVYVKESVASRALIRKVHRRLCAVTHCDDGGDVIVRRIDLRHQMLSGDPLFAPTCDVELTRIDPIQMSDKLIAWQMAYVLETGHA